MNICSASRSSPPQISIGRELDIPSGEARPPSSATPAGITAWASSVAKKEAHIPTNRLENQRVMFNCDVAVREAYPLLWRANLFFAQSVQPRVDVSQRHKLLMGAFLNNPSTVHDQNPVCLSNSRGPVCNKERSLPP
jgi:hypothetical protein